nr:hypothetical protein [uncultured Fluviicola sp.]
MKKLTILLSGLLLSLSACKKEYTCSCSNGIGGASYSNGTVKETSKAKATSDQACTAN